MTRLFRFLLLLVAQGYWGEVRIRFKAGKLVAPITAEQEWAEDTLPQPVPGTSAASAIADQEGTMREVFREARKAVS